MGLMHSLGFFLKSKPVPTTMRLLHTAGDQARLNVVFIHGLDGDAIETWCFDRKGNCWESWLLAEEPRLNIYTVGYRVRSSNWLGGAMQLSERVINVLAMVQTTLRGDIPILFVCHSYGGLVAKEMLRIGLDIDRAYTDVVRRTAGLAFFGTPHAGSRIANYIAAMESARPSRAVRELRANNAQLFDLSHWFRNRFAELGVRVVILYETMDTYGVRVVDRDSSDPGINGITPIPFDCDHVDLPKPQEEGDLRVALVKRLVRDLVPAEAPVPTSEPQRAEIAAALTPLQKLLVTPNSQIERFIDEMQARLAEDPRDEKVREALLQARAMQREISNPIRLTPPPESHRRWPSRLPMYGIATAATAALALFIALPTWNDLGTPVSIPTATEPHAAPNDPVAPEAGTEIAVVPKPSADTADRIAWVKGYKGGDCFYAAVTSATGRATEIAGFGTHPRPFEQLLSAFETRFDQEPDIQVHLIDPRQCEVTRLLGALRDSPAEAPRLTLDRAAIPHGAQVTGALKTRPGTHTSLLLIDHAGMAYNLNGFAKAAGDRITFSVPMGLNGAEGTAKGATPQILLALTGPRELTAAAFAGTSPASIVVPEILAEIAKQGSSFAATAEYVRLGG